MPISDLTHRLSAPFQYVWNQASSIGQQTKNRVAKWMESKRNYWKETDFWKQYGSPFYTRNIKPLNKKDFLILTGSVLIASLIVKITTAFFGIAVLPLSMWGAALVVMGACSFTRMRVRNYFSEIAWEHLDAMRKIASQITYTNQQFGEINRYRGLLLQPEFKHLKEDIEQLDKEINKFKDVVTKFVPAADLADSKKAFIEYVEALQKKLAQHKPIEKVNHTML